MMILKCAFDIILKERKKFITLMFLIVIILILFMSALMIKVSSNFAYEECNALLSGGIKNTAKISIENEFLESVAFIDEVNEMDEVSYFGTMASYELADECFLDFHSVQKAFYDDFENEELGVNILFMNPAFFQLCDIELEEGKQVEELDYLDEMKYLYLGYEYYRAGIADVGDSYKDSWGRTYMVAGFLSENQKWMKESLIYGFYSECVSYADNADRMIFCIDKNEISSNTFLVGVSDGSDVSAVIDKIRTLMQAYGYQTTYMSFEEMFLLGMNDSRLLYDLIYKIAIVVSVVSIIMFISIYIVLFDSESKGYGVRCAMGFEPADIEKMLVLRNAVMFVMAYLISAIIFIFIAKRWHSYTDTSWLMNNIIAIKIFPWALLLDIILFCMVSVFIDRYLRKHSIVQMLFGR